MNEQKMKGGDLLRTVAVLLAGLIIIIVSMSLNLGQEHIGILVIASGLVYATFSFLNNRKEQSTPNTNPVQLKPGISRYLVLTFFLILLISNCLIITNIHRPTLYFFILPLCASLIGAQIVYMKKGDVNRILIQIMLLAISLWAGLVFNYATLWGSDIFFHHDFASFIIEIGRIPDSTQYYALQYNDTPIYHIYLGISILILNTGSVLRVFLSTTLLIGLSLPLVYLIANKITGSVKLSLLATLLYGISDMLMMYSVSLITPGSLNLVLFLCVLTLAFSNTKGRLHLILIVMMLGVALLTHQVTIAVIVVVFFSFFISDLIYKARQIVRSYHQPELDSSEDGNNEWKALSHWVYVLLGIGVVAFWFTSYSRFGDNNFLFVYGKQLLSVFTNFQLFNPFQSVSAQGAISNTFFQLGYLLLLFLAIVGLLHLMKNRGGEKKIFSIVLASVILVLVIYGTPLTPLQETLLTYRWFTFLYLFLVIGAAYCILLIPPINIWHSRTNLIAPLVCLVFMFFMITTPFVSSDNLLFEQNRATRSGFTTTEVITLGVIGDYSDGAILSDSVFSERVLVYSPMDGITTSSYQVDEYNRLIRTDDSATYYIRTSLIKDAFVSSGTQEFGRSQMVILGPTFISSILASSDLSVTYSNVAVILANQ